MRRFHIFSLIILFSLAGCQISPTYTDSPLVGTSPAYQTELQTYSLGVVLTENFRKANAMTAIWGAKDLVAGGVDRVLKSRFSKVVSLANPTQAEAQELDFIAVVDAKVTYAMGFLDSSDAEITAHFRTPEGQQIAVVQGKARDERYAMPVAPATEKALKAFENSLDQQGDRLVSVISGNTEVAETVKTQKGTLKVKQARTFPARPIQLAYPETRVRPDDIAVIIGNADYGKFSKDIPNVIPAYADAESFKAYAIQALGIREGNIIYIRDATGAQLARVFGSERQPHGQLKDWVRAGRSNVYVYYAGHGAPGNVDGSAYLIPSDADAARIDINGYPLDTLYTNLSQLSAHSVTVVLEACFSGLAQGGSVISNASPVFLQAKTPPVPENITVIAAGGADQMASWEQDKSNGLFTKYYLTAMAGAADQEPYGNANGQVTTAELEAYLRDTLTYFARRYYGRDQIATIAGKP